MSILLGLKAGSRVLRGPVQPLRSVPIRREMAGSGISIEINESIDEQDVEKDG